MYHVVESEENHGRSCFVIPNNWMIPERGVCYWPPGPGVESKVKSKKAVDPKTWSVYPAKILKTTGNLQIFNALFLIQLNFFIYLVF